MNCIDSPGSRRCANALTGLEATAGSAVYFVIASVEKVLPGFVLWIAIGSVSARKTHRHSGILTTAQNDIGQTVYLYLIAHCDALVDCINKALMWVAFILEILEDLRLQQLLMPVRAGYDHSSCQHQGYTLPARGRVCIAGESLSEGGSVAVRLQSYSRMVDPKAFLITEWGVLCKGKEACLACSGRTRSSFMAKKRVLFVHSVTSLSLFHGGGNVGSSR